MVYSAIKHVRNASFLLSVNVTLINTLDRLEALRHVGVSGSQEIRRLTDQEMVNNFFFTFYIYSYRLQRVDMKYIRHREKNCLRQRSDRTCESISSKNTLHMQPLFANLKSFGAG